jgi:hypothetical protein
MISPVAGGQARTILNASVPVPSSVYAFEVIDRQAAPGSGHQPLCTAGKAPF